MKCTRSPRPVDRGRPQCPVSYPDNNSASRLLADLKAMFIRGYPDKSAKDNSANDTSAKPTVRMTTVRKGQQCECQQCECDSGANASSANATAVRKTILRTVQNRAFARRQSIHDQVRVCVLLAYQLSSRAIALDSGISLLSPCSVRRVATIVHGKRVIAFVKTMMLVIVCVCVFTQPEPSLKEILFYVYN